MSSHPLSIRRRLRQAGGRQNPGTTAIHVGKAEGQGRRDESYEDGAHPEEGADKGEAIDVGLGDSLGYATSSGWPICKSRLYYKQVYVAAVTSRE